MRVKSVGLLTIAHAAADINQGAIPVLLPFFITAHHLSYAAAATIVFAVNIVSTVTQPLFGYISDRRPRPRLIPVSMLIVGLGVSYTGLAPGYWIGVVAVMVSGLGVAMFHPEGARLMNHLAENKKATAMSLFGIGGQLGFALGPLVATALLLSWGLTGTVFLIVPSVVIAGLVVFSLPALTKGYDIKGTAGSGPAPTGEKDDWPAFLCLSSALLCRSVIFYGLNTFLPLFWINVMHGTKAAAGFALAVFLGSAIAGNFMGGRTADRVGLRGVTIIAFIILSGSFPLLLLAGRPVIALLLLVPIGLLLAAPFGPMVVLGQSYLPNRIGLASGITLGLAFSFGGLTTPVLGWIADHHGLRATMSVVAFMPIICTCLLLMLPRGKKDKAPPDRVDSRQEKAL
jgi:FSR family fosmidomycin resistance protein-like MFS transporter